ncbi:ribonuclease H-like domain-containing protein [Suillus americanus]|nr:ribonuclease H-like domain-containing protein [Suillus americanus]
MTQTFEVWESLRGRAFDERAGRALISMRHWALALVIMVPLIPTVHQEVSLIKRHHVMQNSAAQNEHQHCNSQHYTTHRDALQKLAPRITIPFMPTPSCTLFNALRPDIRAVPEPQCLQLLHTIHNHITALVKTLGGPDRNEVRGPLSPERFKGTLVATLTSAPMVSSTSGILEIHTDFGFCLEARILHPRLSNKAQGSANGYAFGNISNLTFFTHKRSKLHKPSACLRDTENVYSLMSQKHAISSANEIQPACKKVIPSLFDDDSLDDSNTGNNTDPLEPDTDQPEAEDESKPEDDAETEDGAEPKAVQATLAKSKRTLVNLRAGTYFEEESIHSALMLVAKKNHFQLYKACCQAAGIVMHPCAIPADEDQALSRQSTLDSILITKAPTFTKAGLLEYIMEFIVTKDEMLQLAVNRFTNLADESKEVPNLRKKSYNDFKLDRNDWKHLVLIHQVLKEPATAQQSFSSAKHPTASQTIPTLECLADWWQEMANNDQYAPITDAIKQGLRNINKYYKKASDSNVYFICLVLDPNYKLAYVKDRWDTRDIANRRAHLKDVFDKYYKPPTQAPAKEPAPPTRPLHENQYSDAWMREAIKTHQAADQCAHNPHQELTMYLSLPLEEADNILHSLQYPTLARIARDYLPIQGSSIPSKQAFSSRGITSTVRRNGLAASTFSSLQLLKAAYTSRKVHVT